MIVVRQNLRGSTHRVRSSGNAQPACSTPAADRAKLVANGVSCGTLGAPAHRVPGKPRNVLACAPMRTCALALLLVLACPLAASAQEKQDFSKVQIKATKVAGQIYIIEDVTPEF